MEVKWAQFAKVVLEDIVSLTRSIFVLYGNRSQLLCSSPSPLIIPCLACYYLAGVVFEGVFPNFISTEPGSVGDISDSCTADFGKHQVPFLYSSSTLTNKVLTFPSFFPVRAFNPCSMLPSCIQQ